MSDHIILRAIAAEPMTTKQIQSRVSSVAKVFVASILTRLSNEGRIVRVGGGKWQLTSLGYSMLSGPAPSAPMRPYVPERIVRRPGSDRCSTLPSRVAGRLVYPR
jgi:hypothetical protein